MRFKIIENKKKLEESYKSPLDDFISAIKDNAISENELIKVANILISEYPGAFIKFKDNPNQLIEEMLSLDSEVWMNKYKRWIPWNLASKDFMIKHLPTGEHTRQKEGYGSTSTPN